MGAGAGAGAWEQALGASAREAIWAAGRTFAPDMGWMTLWEGVLKALWSGLACVPRAAKDLLTGSHALVGAGWTRIGLRWLAPSGQEHQWLKSLLPKIPAAPSHSHYALHPNIGSLMPMAAPRVCWGTVTPPLHVAGSVS